jgi:CRP/FNR family transcriptional regulator
MDDRLRNIERFSTVSEPVLHELSHFGRIATYKKGETLFFEGDECTALYLVMTGSVKIAKTLESGKELIVDILGPGEGVGEVALLDDLPVPASAIAHTDSELYVLRAQDYFMLLERQPELSRAIIRDLASRLRMLNRRLKDVSGGNVEYRIAHLLLTLGDRTGTPTARGLAIHMNLSRQEIADMVGTTIETTIRIMSRLSKEHVVETTKEGFIILDPERLRQIAETSL